MTHNAKMSRRSALSAIGCGAGVVLLGGAVGDAPKPARKPPNIVFILADDLGYGDLGCYGQTVIQTPCLDAMAAEGVRFTQVYAGSTVCAPSRCCLMTGLHTGHARVRGNKLVPLLTEDMTVAELLKSAGYSTALFGKWGLGEPGTTGVPNAKGFDEFFGYLNQGHAHNSFPTYLWRNETKEPLEGNTEQPDHKGVCGECKTFSNDLFTREALSFLERKKDGPFFLYLAYTLPHANNERGGLTGDGMETPSYEPYADRDWPNPQKGHAALISRFDRDVGRVLQKLRDLGIDQDTIVFFSSDNGTHKEGGANPAFFKSSGPLRGIKRDLYEGGIRVPTIVRWPGTIPAGTVSDAAWAFWDFLPTAADLVSVHPPRGIDGITALPMILGKKVEGHKYFYWEFHERGFSQALRFGDWKAVRLTAAGADEPGPIELYDLAKDIGEAHNAAADHPDIVARAQAYFHVARTESELWPIKIES